MNDIKAVLFDLDGTLLDSMYVWQYVDEEFLRRRGITPPDDYGRQCSHRSFYETALYTIDLFKLPETPEQLMQEWTDLAIDEYRHNVKLYRTCYIQIFSILSCSFETVELALKSGYKTAVCTSQTPELYTPVLHHTGLWGMFETISSAAVFGKGKQYPDIYLDTAKTLGIPPENCIMLDDVSASLKAARQAGMMTIGIIEPLSSQSPEEMELYSDKLVKQLDKDIFTF